MDVKSSQVTASTATKSSTNVGASAATGGQECAGCGKHITDRYEYTLTQNYRIILQRTLFLSIFFVQN